MFFSSRHLILTICLFSVLSFLPKAVFAQPDLELTIEIADAFGLEGDSNVSVEVYLSNYTDSVSAFELAFQLNRPDVARLQLDIETANTLVEGWDLVTARYPDSSGTLLRVFGLCDTIDAKIPCGFAPQVRSKPLFILKAHIEPRPVIPSGDVVELRLIPFLDWFSISTPDGRSLGISLGQFTDSIFYRCAAWLPPDSAVCLEWERVIGPPYDSLVVETVTRAYFDENKVEVDHGSITRVPAVCGDIDDSFDGVVSLGDLTRMVDFLFVTLEPLTFPRLGNTDGSSDGQISLGDLTALIDFMFISLQPLSCEPD